MFIHSDTSKVKLFMDKGEEYRSLRLKPKTIDVLKDVKLAFEASYLERMTMDALMDRLVACLEEAEPSVWDNLCAIQQKKGQDNG